MIRNKVMTIQEFLDYANMSKKERFINEIINEFKYNKQLKIACTFGLAIALILISNTTAHAAEVNTGGIDKLGNTLLYLVRKSGRWVCLVLGLINVIKVGLSGGNEKAGDVVKVLGKYILIYATLYFFPYVLDLIEDCFR
ncbi:hypothetical protein [Clostridium thermobutyricum]|uniref:Uncharacterized protein n=1 Tax=Clostridium thermobutyricum DSM 4928 TaxID=1121339 RepID=A0A1V4SWB2_9CLOT|nr:hypothetical protein [Clostridium thermobutyricum]OPX47856.1 hypothetical protein CLTHE_14270 [Clostridium thermobutyricum DSM 4928]